MSDQRLGGALRGSRGPKHDSVRRNQVVSATFHLANSVWIWQSAAYSIGGYSFVDVRSIHLPTHLLNHSLIHSLTCSLACYLVVIYLFIPLKQDCLVYCMLKRGVERLWRICFRYLSDYLVLKGRMLYYLSSPSSLYLPRYPFTRYFNVIDDSVILFLMYPRN